ncbi:MAG: hypothetical protein ACQETQ_04355 [Spirochaetota bacterium]
MAIQPIDMQTLLMRLGQVGKEQAAYRQAAAQSQAVTGSEIAQRSEELQRAVSRTNTLEDGPEKVNDEENSEQGSGEKGHRGSEEEESREDENLFHDPDLGQNVDISG